MSITFFVPGGQIMKKKILLITIIVCILLCMTACKKKEQSESGRTTESGQTETSVVENKNFIKEIKDKLKMDKELSIEDIKNKYEIDAKESFSEFICLVNSKEDKYEEVLVGKLKNEKQLEEIQNYLARRVEAIRLEVKDEKIKSSLEQLSSVINQEEKGYVIMIVSENAQDLLNEIESLM